MFLPLDDDRPKDECGGFGIYGHDDAAAITTLGLHLDKILLFSKFF